ncbi:phosphotransferase [Deefgea piscis]|uniref:Phosphotransferase n=1 Tax=Deefgea piscis TaxID=2739061 RepID=A0A6M8SUF0_9NEIS|nr:phosphotransferase [Deefgea piscis]QKJ67146.1 phosphotransferase [Deefgea piscis]
MNRSEQLSNWLQQVRAATPQSIVLAAADASVRQYWRVSYADGSVVVMDFDPAVFDCAPFLARQQQLAGAGIAVPQVFEQDLQLGFVVLEDLGDVTLASVLSETSAKEWYLRAIKLLVEMQANTSDDDLPLFDAAFVQRELDICREWYFGQQFGVTLAGKELATWERACALIVQQIIQQPTLFMHRDFHSRNILVQNDALRLIDFQDAVKGPIAYDLVSLLRDAYVEWGETFVLDLTIRYWEQARAAGLAVHDDFGDFYLAFEMAGLQRHLKILGLFARLKYRDNKPQYQADIPRVFHYVRQVCLRYSELTPLGRLLVNLNGEKIESGFTF